MSPNTLALSPALSCTLFLAYSPVFQKPAWTILFQVHGIIFNKCSHTFNTAQLQPKLPSQCQSKKELFAGDHKLNTLHIYPGPVQFKNQIQLPPHIPSNHAPMSRKPPATAPHTSTTPHTQPTQLPPPKLRTSVLAFLIPSASSCSTSTTSCTLSTHSRNCSSVPQCCGVHSPGDLAWFAHGGVQGLEFHDNKVDILLLV